MRTRTIPCPEPNQSAKSGSFCAFGECDVFQHFRRDAGVAADGIVSIAPNHEELSVGSGGRRSRIVHILVGKMFCQAAVDKRNERFLVPRLRDLLAAKKRSARRRFLGRFAKLVRRRRVATRHQRR